MSVGQTFVDQILLGHMSIVHMSVGQISVGQIFVDKILLVHMSVEQISVGQMSVGQMTCKQMSVG